MTCIITQGFGENANAAYKGAGLKGHSGIDENCGWGTPIYPIVRMYVYKVLDGVVQKSYDGSGFTGVFGVDADGNEWLYGHCDTAASEGSWYETTDIIGYEANHGPVYEGGVEITLAEQKAGDQRGHHRHVQKRPCDLVAALVGVPLYRYGWVPLILNGKYYQVKDYNNGYNGCVDFTIPPDYLNAPETISQKVGIISRSLNAVGDPDSKVVQAFAAVLKAIGL